MPIATSNTTRLPRQSVPFVDLQAQYRALSGEICAAVEGVLSNCNFILGKQVLEFEQAFARFVGVEHAIGVSSGLDALRIALASSDIGPGDEVILPANTFIATALAASSLGARVVLVDCDSTYNLDPRRVEAAVTTKTKAILPVHLTGQPADMLALEEIAARHGLLLIEDAAQAHGAVYRSRPCGSIGLAGCFSFYPAKNLGAAGDGGMITTNRAELAVRARRLRNYGEAAKYDHIERGWNARLDTLQAAILQIKLRHLPEWNRRRQAHAALYKRLLNGIGDIGFQKLVPESTHVYHLFMMETSRRDALRKHLEECGVQTGIHYPTPIHLQPAYADLGYRRGDFPVTERMASRILSLPMYAELETIQVEYVCEQIVAFFT